MLELVRSGSAGQAGLDVSRRPAGSPVLLRSAGNASARYAGTHLIIDLFGASRLDDIAAIRQCLIRCVEVSGATLLHVHLHPFEPNGGVSGVAVLAESHISIHTWPEHEYGAVDVFMCGRAQPKRCIEVLTQTFVPAKVEVEEIRRGRLP